MSISKTYSIRCPECGREQAVELYDSINVAQEPNLKNELYKNRLNRVRCIGCDTSFRIDKPLLYHDADRNILIHWMPDTVMSREEILDEFDRTMEDLRGALPPDMASPRVRLVFTRAELVELVFIIEAGMEERVVEYIKYTIYARNMDRLPPAEKQLLLNVQRFSQQWDHHQGQQRERGADRHCGHPGELCSFYRAIRTTHQQDQQQPVWRRLPDGVLRQHMDQDGNRAE